MCKENCQRAGHMHGLFALWRYQSSADVLARALQPMVLRATSVTQRLPGLVHSQQCVQPRSLLRNAGNAHARPHGMRIPWTPTCLHKAGVYREFASIIPSVAPGIEFQARGSATNRLRCAHAKVQLHAPALHACAPRASARNYAGMMCGWCGNITRQHTHVS